MKKSLLLLLLTLLFVQCQQDESVDPSTDQPNVEQEQDKDEESENEGDGEDQEDDDDTPQFTGENYIRINAEKFTISSDQVEAITPIWLTVDSYNLLDVNIDPNYTFYFDSEPYESGTGYKFYLPELSFDAPIELCMEDNISGERYTFLLNTLPEIIGITEFEINNPEAGVYYTAHANYVMKISTEGKYIFYKYVNNASLLNRFEFDGEVFYTYTEEVESVEYPTITGTGSYRSKSVVMNSNYEVVDQVLSLIETSNVGDIPLDNHQFEMLGKDHYLISAYAPEQVFNIPSLDEGVGANVVAAVIQEIKDGELLFSWKSTDHPELYAMRTEAAYGEGDNYLDYLHLNSVVKDPADGNYIASCRSISSLLKIDSQTGDIIWILGGVGDMFSLNVGNTFIGQHDIKITPDGAITIFNNNVKVTNILPDARSGVMKFYLDEQALKVTKYESYFGESMSTAEGSAQELGDGIYLVGWGLGIGAGTFFSEVNFVTGETLFEAYRSRGSTYKVFKYDN